MKITSAIMKNEFCVFILTHGRPNEVKTVRTLLNQRYTGDYYLVLDDEDSTIDEYKKNFGEDKIIVFSKERMKGTFDKGDTNKSNKVIIYARNICFDLAQYLGYTYFLELDDDYSTFEFRKEVGDKFPHIKVRNLDNVFRIIVNYLENTNAKNRWWYDWCVS